MGIGLDDVAREQVALRRAYAAWRDGVLAIGPDESRQAEEVEAVLHCALARAGIADSRTDLAHEAAEMLAADCAAGVLLDLGGGCYRPVAR